MVVELLLQRTRAETVEAVYPFFFRRFPHWRSLASASPTELKPFLKPLGLWRRRILSVKALGASMVLRHGRYPKHQMEILSLPGVGQYIGNAIMLFAWNRSVPLLDVNMARVLERVFGSRKLADIRYDPFLQGLAASVLRASKPMNLNWAVLDLGALICRPAKPLCNKCPVSGMCQARVSV